MKKAKFAALKFKNNTELAGWLKDTASKKIHLTPAAGDMQTIWIHKSGEILFTDYHSNIYVGKFVDIAKMGAGKPLRICDNGASIFKGYGRLIVESIEPILQPTSTH